MTAPCEVERNKRTRRLFMKAIAAVLISTLWACLVAVIHGQYQVVGDDDIYDFVAAIAMLGGVFMGVIIVIIACIEYEREGRRW